MNVEYDEYEYDYESKKRQADYIRSLERKIVNLKQQVTVLREAQEDRNRQLKATKLIVYCSGGCPGGVPDKDYITEEVVAEAERNTVRLRKWWENRKFRLKRQNGE